MPIRERFHSKRAKEILIDFIAANGESYNMYVPFAKSNGWRIYTRGSFHSFTNRNRDRIMLARARFEERVKELTELTKLKRVQMLEEELEILRLDRDNETDSMKRMKLSEQIRRTLQSISMERGEWNKPEADDIPDTGLALIRVMTNRIERLNPPIDASYDIIEDEGTEELTD